MNEEQCQTINGEAMLALIENNNRLKARISDLEQRLSDAQRMSLETLGALRLQETILVHVGTKDFRHLETQLVNSFGPEAAGLMTRHLYILDNAPLSSDIKAAIRKAYIQDGSFTKW